MNTEALIRSSRRTVLVVEDEIINREMLGYILRDQYDVLFAGNGQEALEQLRAFDGTVAMILLDINMPVMNGYELMDALKADALLSSIPVIVLTSDRDAELSALSRGAMDFIPKPYDMPEVILARVRRIIEFTEDRRLIKDIEHDELTGLYSRNFFHEYCGTLLSDHKDRVMDMIAVDVDRFRLVNEVKGKGFGDMVLCAIADGIRDLLRDRVGIACRSDADLFFILVERLADYNEVIRCVRHHTAEIEGLGSMHLRVGVYQHVDQQRPAEWFSDVAKSASGSSRNNYAKSITIYDSALNEKEKYNQRLIDDMDEALRQKQFKVYFQPKYQIQGEEPYLYSAEALVRWEHPELGFISPGVFIPLFEGNGLITKLDTYVWQETAAQIHRWQEQFGVSFPVSVNLSRQDLFDTGLLHKVQRIVAENQLTPTDLHLEITESAYAQDVDYMLKAVGELRGAGFRIEMDDFGSGYSSLNMLCLMPIDMLKIDMKFVQNVMNSDGGYRILKLVISMAHSMNLPTIMEGVEDQSQYELVRKAGCDVVQGYYFSRPVDAATFTEMLRGSLQKRRSQVDALYEATRVRSDEGAPEQIIADALSQGYESIYFVNVEDGSYIEYNATNAYEHLNIANQGLNFFDDTQRNIPRVVYRDDQRLVSEAFRRDALLAALEDGRVMNMTYRLSIDGAPVYYRMRASRPDQGKSRYIVVGLTNVHDEWVQRRTSEHIAAALSQDFFTIYYVNTLTDAYIEYHSQIDMQALDVARQGDRFFEDSRMNIRRLVPAEDQPLALAAFDKEKLMRVLEREKAFSVTYRLNVNGSVIHVAVKVIPMNDENDHIVVGIRNIEAQVRRQQEFDQAVTQNLTFSRIAQALVMDYFSIYFVNTETDDFIEFSSHEGYEKLDIEKKGADFFNVCRKNILRVIYPEDQQLVLEALAKDNLLSELARTSTFTLTYRLLFDGVPTYVNLKATRMDSGDTPHIVIGVSNVDTQMRREVQYAEALELANRDALTGVKSKHAFGAAERKLNESIARGEAEPFAVAVCDVNNLKTVNDTQGHRAGDLYLKEACSVICHIFQHSPVFRVGGDEFAALLRGGDYENRDKLAQEIARVSRENRHTGGMVIACGISEYLPGEDRAVGDVFNRADALMYTHKTALKKE